MLFFFICDNFSHSLEICAGIKMYCSKELSVSVLHFHSSLTSAGSHTQPVTQITPLQPYYNTSQSITNRYGQIFALLYQNIITLPRNSKFKTFFVCSVLWRYCITCDFITPSHWEEVCMTPCPVSILIGCTLHFLHHSQIAFQRLPWWPW